jgi:O-acetyl-ADP-ribose deacetylase (regulator of RNase III)
VAQALVVIVAVLVLAVGLLIHFRWAKESDREYSEVVAWLLFALFPVLVLFSFFPDSQFSSSLAGVSATGAIGAFIYIWYYGTSTSRRARTVDERNREIARLKDELATFQQNTVIREHESDAIENLVRRRYQLVDNKAKRIGILAGSVTDVRFVDVWVNSENVYMQMARFFERSLSATIRFGGAAKDEFGLPIEDTIGNELRAKVGERLSVMPATVVTTTSGALRESHNVKAIMHVAAVSGEAGKGYRQVDAVAECVVNVLAETEKLEVGGKRVRSIALPLFGVGVGGGDLDKTARTVLTRVVSHLREHPSSSLRDVWLLAYKKHELEVLEHLLDESPDVEKAPAELPASRQPAGRSARDIEEARVAAHRHDESPPK